MKAAIARTGLIHLPCLAHTFNLIVLKGLELEAFSSIQTKVKKIVEHFHRSNIATSKFESLQIQMTGGKKAFKLINDMKTRWNSTFYMFQRICELQEPLEATLGVTHSPVQSLLPNEWEILKEAEKVLKPFEQITVELSCEKFTSSSKVIVMVKGLYKLLQNIAPTIQSSVCKELINVLTNETQAKFKDIEYHPVFSKCTFLDPRYKQYGFNNDDAISVLKKKLINDMSMQLQKEKQRCTSVNMEMECTEETNKSLNKNEEDIWQFFDKKVDSSKNNTTSVADAVIELRQYNEEPLVNREEDPLKWWVIKQTTYPHLAVIAKKYLSVPATSVPSERVFSIVGHVVSERRNRLRGDNVEKIMFLNGNKDLLK